MKRFVINKERCSGCGMCVRTCPGATIIDETGKAEIIDENLLEQYGGISICPFGAIESTNPELMKNTQNQGLSPASMQGMGKGMGRGLGRGMGRGMGIGPRDGRGRGRGGGGRGRNGLN